MDLTGDSVEPGNIDLHNRPRVRNADGSISTVRSMSFNMDGQEVLVPTVSDDGRIMSDDEAVQQYRQTGRHLGKFRTPDAAEAYAQQLHLDQEREYVGGSMSESETIRDQTEAMLKAKSAPRTAENFNRAMQAILAGQSTTDFDSKLDDMAAGRASTPSAMRRGGAAVPTRTSPGDVASADAKEIARGLPSRTATTRTGGTAATTVSPAKAQTTPQTAAPVAPVQQNPAAAEATKPLPSASAAPVATDAQQPVGAPVATPKLTGVGMNAEAPLNDANSYETLEGLMTGGLPASRAPYNPTQAERDAGAAEAKQQEAAFTPTEQTELARLEAVDPPIQPTIGPFDIMAGGASGLANAAWRGGSALVGAVGRQLARPQQYGPPMPPGHNPTLPPGVAPRPQNPGPTTPKPAYSVTAPTGPSAAPSPTAQPVPITQPMPRNTVVPIGGRGPTAPSRPSEPPPVSVQMPTGGPGTPLVVARPQNPGQPVAPGIPPQPANLEAVLAALRERGPPSNSVPGQRTFPTGTQLPQPPAPPPARIPQSQQPLPPAGAPPRSGPAGGTPAAPGQQPAPLDPTHIPQRPAVAQPEISPQLAEVLGITRPATMSPGVPPRSVGGNLPTNAPNPGRLTTPTGNAPPNLRPEPPAPPAAPAATPTVEELVAAMVSGSRVPPTSTPPATPQVFRPQSGATPTKPAPKAEPSAAAEPARAVVRGKTARAKKPDAKPAETPDAKPPAQRSVEELSGSKPPRDYITQLEAAVEKAKAGGDAKAIRYAESTLRNARQQTKTNKGKE